MKIGINDLSAELASLICNKFRFDYSVHTITTNTHLVPIGADFNPKFDEMLVTKNSVLLSTSDYEIVDGKYIRSLETANWEASEEFPKEFNFVILKSVIPGIHAGLSRGTYTITEPTKAIPITSVQGYNRATDELILIKNGTFVTHDHYEIREGMIYAIDDAVWEATSRSPVIFEFIVLKFVTPANSPAINGYHLLDNSVELSSLSPTVRNLLNNYENLQKQFTVLLSGIQQYGSFELKEFLKENLTDTKDSNTQAMLQAQKEYRDLQETFTALQMAVKTLNSFVDAELNNMKTSRELLKTIYLNKATAEHASESGGDH